MTIKKITGFVIAAILCFTMSAAALAQSLVPGGKALGIRMTTDGVMVAGVSEVETENGAVSPAADAGILKGDIITRLGSAEIDTAEDFKAAASALSGEKISVTVDRQGSIRQFNVQPALGSDGCWKLGLWLRDGVSGVGTLTFYDPESGIYGALGHSISDADTGAVLPLGEGSIYDAEIVGIVPGEAGTPGELDGDTDEAAFLGDIRLNCGCGIFGCTVSGDTVSEYEIEIKKVYETSDFTTVMLTVTDPELLAQTGGIVQGMSGSPIIQEGKLVGAVTHVFVNDPTSGYGISIQDMLSMAEKCA